jgi:hypothetical protein
MSIPSDEAVAWFFMAEGSASLGCTRRNESRGLMSILGYRVSPRVSVGNTDLALLEPIKKWLESRGIHFNFYGLKRRRNIHRQMFYLKVDEVASALKFLSIIFPHLVGRKRLVCKLMLECLPKCRRENWSDLMREKVIRDKATGRIMALKWDHEKERARFLEIMKYRDKIAQLNGNHHTKYNYDFFAKLWGIENV